MDFKQFQELSKQYSIVPVYEKVTADMLTPVMAYLKIREPGKYCFLLESVEGIGRWARYSFLGKDPTKIIYNTADRITCIENGNKTVITENLFQFLKKEIVDYNYYKPEDLPDFTGGIVGYLGYENIALIEDVIQFKREHEIDTPDSIFALYDTIIAFDHYRHQLILIKNIFTQKSKDLETEYHQARQTLKLLRLELAEPISYKSDFKFTIDAKVNGNDEHYKDAVVKGKNHIYEGDVFQIVLSKRFQGKANGDLLNVYRALRMINPSPYMYFLEFADRFTIIGTSPEDLLKVKDRRATILPIAGTRKRGRSKEEDRQLEQELLADEKERAEHVMLVDLYVNMILSK
jgi:anthranilate synthase component 1